MMQEMKEEVPEVGKGGAGLPLPPGVVELPLLLHRPASR